MFSFLSQNAKDHASPDNSNRVSWTIVIGTAFATGLSFIPQDLLVRYGVDPWLVRIFAGSAAWFATGIDDFMMFLTNYLSATNLRERLLAILGLLTGVALMITLV